MGCHWYSTRYGAASDLLFTIALLIFDHLLTLSREVRLVWGRKFSGPSVIFVVVHYIAITKAVLTVTITLPWSMAEYQVSGVPERFFWILF